MYPRKLREGERRLRKTMEGEGSIEKRMEVSGKRENSPSISKQRWAKRPGVTDGNGMRETE